MRAKEPLRLIRPSRSWRGPVGPLEDRLRSLVGRRAFGLGSYPLLSLDGLSHGLPLPERVRHNLCLAADVTVGWGPDASDWERQRTPFLRRFYRWYWNGRCPDCFGEGTIEIWRRGDPTNDFHTETCSGCQGSGKMPEETLARV